MSRLPPPLIGLLFGFGMGTLLALGVVIGGAPVEPALLAIIGVFGAFGIVVGAA